jgi:hypothetical protein
MYARNCSRFSRASLHIYKCERLCPRRRVDSPPPQGWEAEYYRSGRTPRTEAVVADAFVAGAADAVSKVHTRLHLWPMVERLISSACKLLQVPAAQSQLESMLDEVRATSNMDQ